MFIEYRQEIGTADEDQRSDFVEHIEKHNRNRDQRAQDHQQHRMFLTDRLEQTVKSQSQENNNDLVEQFAPDAEAEERFGSANVIGRRSGVFRHHDFAGDIHETNGGRYSEQEIPESRDACLFLGCVHIFSPKMRFCVASCRWGWWSFHFLNADFLPISSCRRVAWL